ncbi:MAG: AAA family ATPase [Bacilli bacterium]
MKLTKQVAPLLKEWCDMLLFCNYKTYVVTTENNTKKAQGGKRVVYTSHHACWDAKNRYGLPDELDLDFKGIAHLFSTQSPKNPSFKGKRRV